MARRPIPPAETPPSLTPERANLLLQGQLDQANALLAQPIMTPADVQVWQNTTREYLIQAFGSASKNISSVISATSTSARLFAPTQQQFDRRVHDDFEVKAKMLGSCIEQLRVAHAQSPAQPPISRPASASSGEIFVVHGHNSEKKLAVARTLEKLGLKPIILHEMPNEGKTVIEKFTKHANVGFAVIIMTADDLGRAKKEKEGDLKQRARQNVVFEWGYFIGRLGRERVCALYEEGIESPSDLDGFVYTSLDEAGHWRFALIKELKAVGYNVDANKLVE